MAGFLLANMGAAEARRKHGIPPATSGNRRRRFVDAGRRDLGGAGGSGRGDPAKALAGGDEPPGVVAGEQALAPAAPAGRATRAPLPAPARSFVMWRNDDAVRCGPLPAPAPAAAAAAATVAAGSAFGAPGRRARGPDPRPEPAAGGLRAPGDPDPRPAGIPTARGLIPAIAAPGAPLRPPARRPLRPCRAPGPGILLTGVQKRK